MKNDDKEYVQIKFITYILLVLTILPIGGALITEVFAQEEENYIVYDYEQMREMERIEEEFILAKEEADQEKTDEANEIIEIKERKKELEKIRQEEKMKELEEKRAEEQKRIDEELERQRLEEEERQRQEEQQRLEEEERQRQEEAQYQNTNVSYGSASDAFYALAGEKGLSESEINGWANIISRESGWSVYAQNPYSGAYGLGQALPGSKMASHGSDWQSNPYTQLSWMYDYMVGRYGSIQGAVDFWNANHWY